MTSSQMANKMLQKSYGTLSVVSIKVHYSAYLNPTKMPISTCQRAIQQTVPDADMQPNTKGFINTTKILYWCI